MISKAQAKRKQDIKTKLMAAIAMLLVSSIMMVSSTYAWFTLSTAPEVTGITTAVGANGNLEMLLLPANGVIDAITSAAGDSTKADNLRNNTWGNLVDVSNNTFYGMDKIKLYPAALNVDNSGKIPVSVLKTPTYGADGRVSELLANTVTGIYADNAFIANTTAFGVRAVGTASAMTDRQLAYRDYISTANSSTEMAKRTASDSLNKNGEVLATIVLAKAAEEGGNPVISELQLQKLTRIVYDLVGNDADGTTGAIEYIEEAYRNYILAYVASGLSGITDDQFNAARTALESATLETLLNGSITVGETPISFTPPGDISGYVNALTTTKSNASSALAILEPLQEKTDATWEDIDGAFGYLADMSKMDVNGIPATNTSQLMSSIGQIMGSGGVKVTISSGGGVYADIADHCGRYDAGIKFSDGTMVKGINIGGMSATMIAAGKTNPNLVGIKTIVANNAPESGGSENAAITDMFGYIIDLGFRTNASSSNLLLQTEAVDRIYSDNTDTSLETMGHGSTMTFTKQAADFSLDSMAGLMECIRVVFFDPTDGTIFANAKLDMGITDGVKNYTESNGNTITAKLYICDAETGNLLNGAQDKQVITALGQNIPKKVSVLVYLDGNSIQNKDVAATAATSMSGSMNLQFASDANLIPMDYTPLKEQGGDAEVNEYTVTFNNSQGVSGNPKATKNTAYSFTLTADWTIDSVTIGGQPYTGYTNEGNVYTIPANDVTGAIAINVTAPAPAPGE